MQIFNLLLCEFFHNPSGTANNKDSVRKFFSFGNHGSSPNNTVFTNLGPIENYRTDAD